ncbi:hypothetical protein [Amantichitinum ursilacus]|uniref:Riboflavin biosynthesis protein RibA n=1 Tax=Amantichitinum ursilacus TaxID=857265 RepID=A0A0N0XKW1_9NEIS|nr:hypothetical protein [Amantichitinum ursilacus]KPC55034.1 hypothetical protein WG78_00205 [Amantichitinum ursilacus]
MTGNLFSGEDSRTHVAAMFDSESLAATAAASLRADTGMDAPQVEVVQPHEAHFGRKLEPESRGIVRTAIRAHSMFGGIGLALGVALFGVLYSQDLPAIVSNPLPAVASCAFFGMVFGLLIGGVVTVRPDHQMVITPVREAVQGGRWAVVAHPRSARQADAALRVLRNMTNDVVRSA